MIKDKEIWGCEKSYLKRVLSEIENQIDIGVNAAANYKKDAIHLQKSMWEDLRCAPSSLFDLEDAAQINQIQMELKNKAGIYKFSCEAVSRLRRMRLSPYFGRIDFVEKGEKTAEKIYIGIHSLSAHDTMESLVYDWRAPVSGMFYDFETGPSSYTCPAGLIEGKVTLKRQYRIENSDIVYMFDSSLIINDAMLQELLGKSTDSRMRTIVTSIQKEQNTVIRNSADRILIVEGPAGSGKTSIALHRAAYLLYRYRDTLSSENILIFSPNHVFEDYISHVLPELGEENIKRSTFADYFARAFPADKRIETMNQQMEYILTANNADDIRLDCIRFKSSPVFLGALKRYVRALEEGAQLKLKDLVYDNAILITAEEIRELYDAQSGSLPYANRLEKLRKRLFGILDEYKRAAAAGKNPSVNETAAQQEYERAHDDILKTTDFDVLTAYTGLFNDIALYAQAYGKKDEYLKFADYTLGELEQGTVNYEDLAPIVYLKTVLEGESASGTVKHIIIDEAQDYTALHYEIFKAAFKKCNMTILGDINQTVNGYMNIGDFGAISDTLGAASKRIALKKSYRSSKELAGFCRRLLASPGRTEQLSRHGAKPKVIKVSADGRYGRMADDIAGLKNKGHKLIAVVCKTATEARAVYRSLSSYMSIGFISNQNETYHGDCFVIPSYLAKGLEFDAVLVSSAEDKDYNAPEDARLLYTVCTRALHELYLYCSGTVSRFISAVDKKLYDVEQSAG